MVKKRLSEESGDYFAGDIGEPIIAAFVAVDELLMIDAEEVEHGGVEIMNVGGIADDIVAEVVGFAVHRAWFDAPARHPDGEATGMMIATEVVLFDGALAVSGAAEFAAPDDESFVEEPALFEIGDEGGASLIGFQAFLAEAFGETAMMIPVAVAELDEADIAFGESASEEAIIGEAGSSWGGAVEIEDLLAFRGEVGEFGDAGLHPESEFVVFDLGGDGGISDGAEGHAVEVIGGVDEFAAGLAADAWGIGDKEHGIAGVAELDAPVLGGEKATTPVAGLESLTAATAGEDDERGEVAVIASEAVGEPGAHRGATWLLVSRGEKGDCGIVVDGVGDDRADESAIIDDFGEIGEEFGDIHPGAAIFFEREGGADAEKIFLAAGHSRDALAFANAFGEIFAGHLDEFGFGIKEVEVGGGTGHEEVNDPLGFGGKVESVHGAWGGGSEGSGVEERAEGEGAEAGATFL